MTTNVTLAACLSFRRKIKALLYVSGLWLPEKLGSFYGLLPFVFAIVSAITSFGILALVSHHITRVPVVVRGMSVGTSLLCVILKIFCVISQRKRAIELHEILDHYFSRVLSDEHMTNLMLTGIFTLRRICFTLFFASSFTVFLNFVTPTIDIINQKRNGVQPIKYSLIYPGVYPWDTVQYGVIHQIHFIIEILASVSLFCVTCGVDGLFAFYVFQVTGQLRVMSHRLTHVEEKNNIQIVIRECSQQYRMLLKCLDSMDDIFGPFVLWMMATNAIVLCALIFQLSQITNISIFRVIFILTYLTMKMTQTFIYTWSGTSLIHQSEKYLEAIYEIDWFGKKTIMSSIIIMLCQRPLRLKPFGFSVISMNVFVMILNTAISYFCLLRTVEQKS
ncbi:odorant receptor 22c isoform X1 [Diachasma alloeum]|uniref:Odorant receptor n=1 Tax=Diachasma alloeum TaxID=454923 RepID=A0A4E0S3N4_9HYME|nr:odorant receptor 22c isoform X1 [Diachasma alloeum]THK32875.1 odorant receptor 179 [Diachasma alloeum]